MSQANTVSKKLSYSNHGEPLLKLDLVDDHSIQNVSLQANEAHVRVLYAPVNPSDLLEVYGHFPFIQPDVPGWEGVVEVIQGHSFKPGDRAIVLGTLWGHWRQQGIVDEKNLFKIPNDVPPELAGLLAINPCTAYALVKETVQLEKGDVIIQNAANSFTAQLIIQFAHEAGFKTVNVIRNRPNLGETVDLLKGLGADLVITDDDLANGCLAGKLKQHGLPQPKLAFECVGVDATMKLVNSLAPGGTLVVYGVISREPAKFDQFTVIALNIKIIGFNFNRWAMEKGPDQFFKVLNELISLFTSGKLKVPATRTFPLSEWREAITHASKGFTNEKVLLRLN